MRSICGGRPRSTDLKAVLNAIFYVLISGCSWRMLPGDFPAWQTVYSYFRRWRLDGTWVGIHRYLREWVRLGKNRHGSASVGIIDSQSVEIGVLTNISVGYDGGKKVKGRKRHLLVDTMGLVLMVVVTAGNISDAKPLASSPPGRTAPKGLPGAKVIFQKLKSWRRSLSRLFLIYTDGTYRGEAFVKWVFNTYDLILEAVLRTDQRKGFRVVHKRWLVERTFGWCSAHRRRSSSSTTSEA